jgi:MFS family permease
MLAEFDSKDTSKPNYYYIYLILSSLLLFLSYIIIYILNYLKKKNISRKASLTLEVTKLDINQIIENYKTIYNTENMDMDIINNINEKAISLKIRYLLVYLCTRASIWSKAPYIYLLFNKYHNFTISEIGILYIIDAVCALIFGPITGDLADKYGRRLFCLLYCVCGILSQTMRISGNIPLVYFSQVITGIGAGLISTTFESWINYESEKDLREGKRVFLEKLFKTQTILDSVMSLIISGLGAILYTNFGLLYPIIFSIFLSGLSIIFMFIFWDENKPNSIEEYLLYVVYLKLNYLLKIKKIRKNFLYNKFF